MEEQVNEMSRHWALEYKISVNLDILQKRCITNYATTNFEPCIKYAFYTGVLGSARTCLHAVIAVLERGVTARTGPSAIHNTPQLAELSYELVYRLCANRDTSAPTMRYLRTTQDFFFKHLRHAPFSNRHGGMCDIYLYKMRPFIITNCMYADNGQGRGYSLL